MTYDNYIYTAVQDGRLRKASVTWKEWKLLLNLNRENVILVKKKVHFIGKYFSLLGSQHKDMNEYILSYIWGYSENYN